MHRPRNKWPDRLSCGKDVPYGREQLTKRNKAGGNSFAPVQIILDMPGCATPLVKSRTSAGICRNLNRIFCFHDAHGFNEIGFVCILTTENRQLRTGGIAIATWRSHKQTGRAPSLCFLFSLYL